ncbi:MAG: hypothetical protein K2H74_07755 [Paramuribaculum sp.]|nr:hypothetical protein [Paramuribaculum sp.]
MRKFLLFLCACMLIPALTKAENKFVRVLQGTYNANTYSSCNADRLVVPYTVLGTGAMDADDSYTIGMWTRLFTTGSSAAKFFSSFTTSGSFAASFATATYYKIESRGAVFARFGTIGNMNFGGNWCIGIKPASATATSGVITVYGDDASENGAGVGFTSIKAKDIPITSTDEWMYVAIVVDNTNLKASIYYNDELAGEVALSAPMYYSGDDCHFQFGGLGMRADFDEIQLFNSALSASEVATAMYNPSAISSLKALYTFDSMVVGSKSQFANEYGAGVDAKMYYQRYTDDKTKIFAATGLENGTNAEYALATSSMYGTSNRALRIPVAVDPELQNGTIVINNGSETITSQGFVADGTELTIVATPAEGYQLVDLYANTLKGKEVMLSNTYTVHQAVTFSALFSNEFYALTVENPANVEYSITHNGVPVENLEQLVPGTTYKLTVNIPDDVNLKYISLGDKTLTAELDGSYNFSMTEATTLAINAAAKLRYTVNFPTYEQGVFHVTADGAEVTSGSTLFERTQIEINVVANEGYAVSAVYLNGAAINNGASYTLIRDIDLTANFLASDIDHCSPVSVGGSTTTSNTSRYLTNAVISDGVSTLEISKSGLYANNAFGNTSGRPVYDAAAVVPQLIVEPGSTMTITTTGDGEWMNTYIYIDSDLNGLDKADLIYTNYVNETTDNTMAGTSSFIVPRNLKTGVHRLRFMLNWDNNQGPCEYGQAGKDNGEVIFDVDLVINEKQVDNERTITVKSENDALGTVAILDPATDENSVTTRFRYVTVKATPAEGYSFLNWTNAEGKEVSTSATYEYEGAADIELTAHFGYNVAYSAAGEGTMMVTTAAGASVDNGSIVPVASELVFTLTPAAGKAVASFTVNGEDHVADLVANEYTMTVESDVVAAAEFADFTAHVEWTVRGNGDVEAGYAWNDNGDGAADTFESGDAINVSEFKAEGGLTIFAYPGQTEDGEYEAIESVTMQIGEGEAADITDDVEMGNDSGYNGDGLLESGAPFRYYTISELPSANMMIVFVFTDKGAAASIGNIFSDDDTDAPTLYYNLDGARVNGNALTPGIYIVKKGKKTAKVYVM